MAVSGIILIAVSLSMDALGLGISYGLRNIAVPLFSRIIICLISVAFTGCAVLIGNNISALLDPLIAKFVGAVMLLLIGLFIIYQTCSKDDKKSGAKRKDGKIIDIILKPLGITITIFRNPVSCDLNGSSHIDPLEAVYLGTALSFDSFGVGISSAVAGFSPIVIPISAGICQLIFLSFGIYLGEKIKLFNKIETNKFTLLSGTILIVISLLRFFHN